LRKSSRRGGLEDIVQHVTPADGNIFADLGFPPEEARRLLLRCQLAEVVRDLIEQRKLTQARAAKLLGVTQPRVSDLMRNKLDRFSIDMLISMLTRAGVTVGFTLVEPRAA
jgi:predicted XRE-type DNA-binding protein